MIRNTEETLVVTIGKPCNVLELCGFKTPVVGGKESTNVNVLSLLEPGCTMDFFIYLRRPLYLSCSFLCFDVMSFAKENDLTRK